MAATDGSGVMFFNGMSPHDFSQKLSVIQSALGGRAAQNVKRVVDNARDIMHDKIVAEDRILSHKMLNSVNSEVTTASSGRATGEFGYIDNEPFYTKFQERGTGASGPARAKGSGGFGGIKALLAYADAQEYAIVEFQNLMANTGWFASEPLRKL